MVPSRSYPSWMPQWLWLGAGMVVVMILVGGITRLTESGLSMVTWEPVTGFLPPLSHAAWEDAFAAYRVTPEYQHINQGMSLRDFQGIYWWEFIHRVLGRLTGLVYALPLLFLWVKRLAPPALLRRLIVLPILVAAQGYMGWYMVKSGLIDQPDVSPYRLMMHLSLALIVLGLTVDRVLALSRRAFFTSTWGILMVLYAVMVCLGALVAGLNGGMVYNTFPLMDGMIIPPEVLRSPAFFADPAAVQWAHRVGALVFLGAVTFYAVNHKTWWPLILTCVQIFLGAITVMYQVPILAASLHQVNAALLLISLMFALYPPPVKEAKTLSANNSPRPPKHPIRPVF